MRSSMSAQMSQQGSYLSHSPVPSPLLSLCDVSKSFKFFSKGFRERREDKFLFVCVFCIDRRAERKEIENNSYLKGGNLRVKGVSLK
jgi:hypothetical protein